MGKSWLLCYEARQLAHRAIDCLNSGDLGIDNINLPFLIRLPDLSSGDKTFEDEIVMRIAEARSPSFRSYLHRQIMSNRGELLPENDAR
jgi:hypothetical protein